MSAPLRIFIGSGEASLLERKVLIYSLRKHSSRALDIAVFNGTHDCLEREGLPPQPLHMPLSVKFRNVTEFSSYRFLIPDICGRAGRAAWLDSDTVCLADIGELFDTPMGNCGVLAKGEAYGGAGEERWGLSVSLFDCARAPFDLTRHFEEIDAGLYTYADLHQLSPRFRAIHDVAVGSIDPNWNVFDRHDANTRLIHYTNLLTQPWKARGHPYGELWFQYFAEARREGFISAEDVQLTLVRSYARQDLLEGNDWTLRRLTGNYVREARRLLARRLRALLA
jgi:hypothetical protein